VRENHERADGFRERMLFRRRILESRLLSCITSTEYGMRGRDLEPRPIDEVSIIGISTRTPIAQATVAAGSVGEKGMKTLQPDRG